MSDVETPSHRFVQRLHQWRTLPDGSPFISKATAHRHIRQGLLPVKQTGAATYVLITRDEYVARLPERKRPVGNKKQKR
jgi:hypothetical protein